MSGRRLEKKCRDVDEEMKDLTRKASEVILEDVVVDDVVEDVFLEEEEEDVANIAMLEEPESEENVAVGAGENVPQDGVWQRVLEVWRRQNLQPADVATARRNYFSATAVELIPLGDSQKKRSRISDPVRGSLSSPLTKTRRSSFGAETEEETDVARRARLLEEAEEDLRTAAEARGETSQLYPDDPEPSSPPLDYGAAEAMVKKLQSMPEFKKLRLQPTLSFAPAPGILMSRRQWPVQDETPEKVKPFKGLLKQLLREREERGEEEEGQEEEGVSAAGDMDHVAARSQPTETSYADDAAMDAEQLSFGAYESSSFVFLPHIEARNNTADVDLTPEAMTYSPGSFPKARMLCQKSWRDRTPAQNKAIEDAINVFSDRSVWKEAEALKIVMKSMKKIAKSSQLIKHSGIEALHKKIVSSSAKEGGFVELWKSVISLAGRASRLPNHIPLLGLPVESVTFSHEQVAILLAAQFVSKDQNGFFGCLSSGNEIGVEKLYSMLTFFRLMVSSPPDGNISFRIHSLREFHTLWILREQLCLKETEIRDHSKPDDDVYSSKILPTTSAIGGSIFRASKVGGEEETTMLERPELLVARTLLAELKQDTVVSVIGDLRFCEVRRARGMLTFERGVQEVGRRAGEEYRDVHLRNPAETLIVPMTTFPRNDVKEQVELMEDDVRSLCTAMTAQTDCADVPVIFDTRSLTRTSNEMLMILKALIAATFASRRLVIVTSTTDVSRRGKALMESLRDHKITIGGLKKLVKFTLNDPSLLPDDVFSALDDAISRSGVQEDDLLV